MKHLRNVLVAFSLLLVSSWAPGPSQVSETTPRSSDDSIQHQTDGSGSGTTLVFPDYVDGGGWSVQLALTNLARSAVAEVAVTAHDPEGRPVELFEAETEGEIPPLGSRVYRSAGGVAVRRGWIEVRTDPPSVSGLLTYRHSGSGVEVGVAPVESGDRFALFVEESDEVGSGLAIFKSDRESQIELGIRDEAGQDPVGEVLFRGEFQQAARTLPEWFQGVDTGFLRNFRGLLLLGTEDGPPFAPLGLRFGKGTSSLSAVPAIRTRSEAPQETNLVFPDYVDGGGWSVQLVLINVDPAAATEVRVEVYDPDGQPVPDLFDSDLTLEIPALGSRVLRSTSSGAIRRGWIQVEADAARISGLLTYRHARSGVEVGVEPARLGNQFALFVEESSAVGAGLAVFKPEASSRIELRVRDEAGRDPLGDVFVPWRDFRQSARTMSEWLDVDGVETGFLENFRGLLFLRSQDGSRFAPLGLRFGKGTGSLSAVPVVRIVDGVRIAGGIGTDGGVEIEGGVGTGAGGKAPPPTVTLSVAPSSIDWGQSATLRWSSTNADRVEITPDVGNVSTSGTQKVSPRTTTTYRITVRGVDGQTATATVTVTVTVSDRAALIALYEATDGPNWVNNEGWLTDAPLEDWYGVETDGSERVFWLDLSGRWDFPEWIPHGLAGPMPQELGNLTHLRGLNLNGNDLTGPIPPELGNLNRLSDLYLSGTALSGPIPPELGNLTNLRNVALPDGVCVPDDLRAWAIELDLSVLLCTEQGRLLPSALMREDGNGLSLALPDDLREPSAVTVSDPSVVAVSVANGWLELVPRSRGSADIEIAPSGGGVPGSARVVVRAAVGTFGIDIVMERPAPVTYEKALMTAADWWSSVLDGTEWPDRQPTCFNDRATAVADELLIHARIDFDIQYAGSARTCFRRAGEQAALDPGGGRVTANPENANPYLVQHEIGHLLGLVIWGPETGLVTEDGAYFVGPQAVEAFRARGGDPNLPGVPRSGPHWDGVVDIMGTNIVTHDGDGTISVAALADAGYTVDMTKAMMPFYAAAPAVDHANDVDPIEPSRHPRAGSSDGVPPH